ncbi:MAG: HD domain-containing protein [Candidatus Aenigmarchaeota archaeon]|nr:HD domain-containing protein [Candidatus Aenigmarchaeota archaeon]
MTEIIKKALLYAYEKHKGDNRKDTKIPYIVHPIDVTSILMKEEKEDIVSDELIAAGLLHDVLEDTVKKPKDKNDIERDIEKRFGKKVLNYVLAASEPKKYWGQSKKEKEESWEPRKKDTIEKMKTTKDADIKLLCCADKLSNLQDMIKDYYLHGEELWERFNKPYSKQKWYYQSLEKAYRTGKSIEDTITFKLFSDKVIELFGGMKNMSINPTDEKVKDYLKEINRCFEGISKDIEEHKYWNEKWFMAILDAIKKMIDYGVENELIGTGDWDFIMKHVDREKYGKID